MSPVPQVFPTRDALRQWNNNVRHWEDRVEKGMGYVLHEATWIFYEFLVENAPEVADGLYPKGLSVAILEVGREYDAAMAIYFKASTREVSGENEAVYISPRESSPDWVSVLAKHNPWPVKLLPVKVGESHALVVTREASDTEIEGATRAIERNSREIESMLLRAGVRAKIGDAGEARGVDDVGFSVLRYELGLQKEPNRHWYKAAEEMRAEMRKLRKKFVRYVETGNDNVFDIPEDVGDELSQSEFRNGVWFQDKIADRLKR